ncbi:hypothetical protein GCM10011414_26060 [Croceivirga lutea]|uniref:glycosyltransferase n=1 Tax=Croceivirga lutea TaxID=1775167 RepID=UPI001639CA39|nr:glycosyltransferase [Croceivirga lutea]GGG54984.1 hypothetical protein GCM10011414_26060 [Croceivirga lutea]
MILIDCSALKSGGGCQLALNFIKELSGLQQTNYLILIPNVGPLKGLHERFPNLLFYTSPSARIITRFIFENFYLPKIIKEKKIRKIYTFFGAGLPKKKNVISIVSVAYPIICYPESPFWKYIPKSKKIKQQIKNWVRIRRLKRADFIIAETQVMADRLSKILEKKKDDIKILKPSPSEFVIEKKGYRYPSEENRILILSGLSPHKNLWRLNEFSNLLMKADINFKFIVSAEKKDFLKIAHSESLHSLETDKHFEFVGSVPPDKINALYEKSDFLLNISDLESFSNNYMEAWKASLPLIVSDTDFSRHICGTSAIYINPHNLNNHIDKIHELLNNKSLQKQLVKEGKKRLKELPTQSNKTRMILDLISELE